MVTLTLSDERVFDDLVHNGAPSGEALRIATKRNATSNGTPAVVLAFDVEVAGERHRVQFSTTLRELVAAARAAHVHHETFDQKYNDSW